MYCEVMEYRQNLNGQLQLDAEDNTTPCTKRWEQSRKIGYHDCASEMEKRPPGDNVDHAAGVDLRGMRRFAFTRSNSSSRDAFSFGMSPRCDGCELGMRDRY
jgi:hypothetical protein